MTPAVLSNLLQIPVVRAHTWAQLLDDVCKVYHINTLQRQACFLAQVAHESGLLRYTREIWGPTKQQLRYEPVTKLSQTLGNTLPGQGHLYMGRGLIQTTGQGNYHKLTARLRKRFPTCPDFIALPHLLEQPFWAAMSAGDYWDMRGLNKLADAYDFAGMTKKINGGYTGLADRQKLYSRIYAGLIFRE